MSAALSQIRLEQGADAVILSQRRLEDGVELMVAPQLPELSDAIVNDPLAADLARLKQEVAALKNLLQTHDNLANKQADANSQHDDYRQLRQLGLSKTLAQRLRHKAAKPGWRESLAELAPMLDTVDEDTVARGGLFVLVGPTGSGKTTTMAKLAARYVMANGADELALVSMDTFGIAANEQLRALGRILRVPVEIVDKQHSLQRVLHDLRHKSLVLVDTAGLSRFDQRLRQQMTRIDELGKRASSLLVIPANSQRAAMLAAYKTYKTANLAACILTKLDDTVSLGEALSFSIEQSLALAYTTDGQEVPDAIAVADSNNLVSQLFNQLADTRKARTRVGVDSRQFIGSMDEA